MCAVDKNVLTSVGTLHQAAEKLISLQILTKFFQNHEKFDLASSCTKVFVH